MSRQRLRPGMLESTTQPCAHCHGTGIIRSDDSLALSILRQLEEENQRLKRLVADLSLDKEMLQEVIKKSSEAGSEASGSAFSAGGLPYQCPTGMRTADAEQNRLPLAEPTG